MIPVVAIFDIGKTNKKLFLIDENYKILWENTLQLKEIVDEDGFVCEDIEALTRWVKSSMVEIFALANFEIKALNFTTYGASFVNLNKDGKIVTSLYNYLKPYPKYLQKEFYAKYDAKNDFSVNTASPKLDSLNSGLQLYRLKYEKPEIFSQVHYSLHLPQYLSYLITKQVHADITSIGCHTILWNFISNNYHEWLQKEEIAIKLPKVFSSENVLRVTYNNRNLLVGIGLHDSSAALIPYLTAFKNAFVLISTGTWCISLNPFNTTPITNEELDEDCLCYMEYRGNPIKASRLFAGYEHEQQTKRLAAHYRVKKDFYKTVEYDTDIIQLLKKNTVKIDSKDKSTVLVGDSGFAERDLAAFKSYEVAYHQLMLDIMDQQVYSTGLIIQKATTKKIFVDGGFSKNPIYMHLLADAFPDMEIFASEVAQATAIGAAQAIHKFWNTKQVPENIIDLKKIIRK
jgi:sugar (pentulose or hexulose) kinase